MRAAPPASITRDHGQANLVRYHFANPGAREFSGNWHATADLLVASLRAAAGRNPRDTAFQDLAAATRPPGPRGGVQLKLLASCAPSRRQPAEPTDQRG